MTTIPNANRNGVIPVVESDQFYPEHYLDDDPDTAAIQQTIESLAGTDFAIPPDRTKEVHQQIIDRQEIDAVGRQLAASLDVSNSRVARTIGAASEVNIRTIYCNGQFASKVCEIHQVRSRLQIWCPYQTTTPIRFALGTEQNMRLDIASNDYPTNGITFISGVRDTTNFAFVAPQVLEIVTVRDLWVIAETGVGASQRPICIIEEFVS